MQLARPLKAIYFPSKSKLTELSLLQLTWGMPPTPTPSATFLFRQQRQKERSRGAGERTRLQCDNKKVGKEQYEVKSGVHNGVADHFKKHTNTPLARTTGRERE